MADPWYTQYLVLFVWLNDTLHQALITHTVYHYVITNYANPLALFDMIWSILAEVLVNGFIGLAVQGYLTHRIWRLSGKNWWYVLIIGPFVISEFFCCLVFTILSLQMTTFAELTELKALSMTVNVLAAAGDLLISASLIYLLQKRRTGFKKSNTIISRLIIFTINTGLVTTLCAMASLVSILVWADTLIYVTFFFCIGRFYANSLLATLNARSMIRNVGEDMSANSVPLSGRHQVNNSTHMLKGGAKPTNISIQIDTAQEYMRDDDDVTMKSKVPST
ncbi:hypothetical protein ONZ45_g12263 [Pleurotus djamor]|nr:hypothetical protein ONZ45_g12263 [Pleurotus djamor]